MKAYGLACCTWSLIWILGFKRGKLYVVRGWHWGTHTKPAPSYELIPLSSLFKPNSQEPFLQHILTLFLSLNLLNLIKLLPHFSAISDLRNFRCLIIFSWIKSVQPLICKPLVRAARMKPIPIPISDLCPVLKTPHPNSPIIKHPYNATSQATCNYIPFLKCNELRPQPQSLSSLNQHNTIEPRARAEEYHSLDIIKAFRCSWGFYRWFGEYYQILIFFFKISLERGERIRRGKNGDFSLETHVIRYQFCPNFVI